MSSTRHTVCSFAGFLDQCLRTNKNQFFAFVRWSIAKPLCNSGFTKVINCKFCGHTEKYRTTNFRSYPKSSKCFPDISHKNVIMALKILQLVSLVLTVSAQSSEFFHLKNCTVICTSGQPYCKYVQNANYTFSIDPDILTRKTNRSELPFIMHKEEEINDLEEVEEDEQAFRVQCLARQCKRTLSKACFFNEKRDNNWRCTEKEGRVRISAFLY